MMLSVPSLQHAGKTSRRESVCQFFNENDETRWDVVRPFLLPKSPIPLRTWDFLVSSFARVHCAECWSLQSEVRPETSRLVNIYVASQAVLMAVNKKNCDPFRRVHAAGGGGVFVFREVATTTAQLTFFRWALIYGIVAYMQLNHERISAEMMALKIRCRQNKQKRQRSGGGKLSRLESCPQVGRQYTPTSDVLLRSAPEDEEEQRILRETLQEHVDLRTAKQKRRKRLTENAWETKALFTDDAFYV
jgi:hypothetical protein